jgi:hypothetical protein
MPRRKMIPPLPDSMGDSEYDRFKRFATAILATPRSEVMPEQALAKLESQKQRIGAKIADVGREIVKRGEKAKTFHKEKEARQKAQES